MSLTIAYLTPRYTIGRFPKEEGPVRDTRITRSIESGSDLLKSGANHMPVGVLDVPLAPVMGMRCHPSVATLLGDLASHPQHRSHTHPKLAGNAADPGPLGACRDDRRHLIRIAILEPPPAELDAIGPGPA
jgi:hypothetical protein